MSPNNPNLPSLRTVSQARGQKIQRSICYMHIITNRIIVPVVVNFPDRENLQKRSGAYIRQVLSLNSVLCIFFLPIFFWHWAMLTPRATNFLDALLTSEKGSLNKSISAEWQITCLDSRLFANKTWRSEIDLLAPAASLHLHLGFTKIFSCFEFSTQLTQCWVLGAKARWLNCSMLTDQVTKK